MLVQILPKAPNLA